MSEELKQDDTQETEQAETVTESVTEQEAVTAEQKEQSTEQGKKSFVCLFIAMGCFAAGFLLLALSIILPFAGVKNVSVHLLIASMISELAAVSFINAQKRKVETKACKLFTILSYVVMGIALLIFVIGLSTVNAAK